MKKIIAILAAAAVIAAAAFGFTLWNAKKDASAAVSAYNTAAQEYNERIMPYNEAVVGIAEANAGLEEALHAAKALLDTDQEAYEPDTKEDLEIAINEAGSAFAPVPPQIDPFPFMEEKNSFSKTDLDIERLEADASTAAVKEALEKIPEIPEIPDFSKQISLLEAAEKAYTDSVQKLANVTAPSAEFVQKRLAMMETVLQAEAVSEGNDPNGLLGKEGGYQGCVYFLDTRVDTALLPDGVLSENDGENGENPSEEAAAEETAPDADAAADAVSTDDASGAEAAASSTGETSAPDTAAADTSSTGETLTPDTAAADASSTGETVTPDTGAADASSTGETVTPDTGAADASSTGETVTPDTGAADASSTGETVTPDTAAADASSTGKTAAAAKTPAAEPRYNVVLAGTAGGGAVEVFASAEEAEARSEYLSYFAESVMDPGSHAVEGTCVLRASRYLEDARQQELIEAVRAALLEVTESGNMPLTSLSGEDGHTDPAGSGSTVSDSSVSDSTASESADPGSTASEAADPGSTASEAADPGSTASESADPGSTVSAEADSGHTDPPDSDSVSPFSIDPDISVPWHYEYRLRGDETFQAHAREVIETGVTAPSPQGEIYYAGPSDDVQGIINRLGPGDTLYLREGVYRRKIRLYGGVQGREDAYITIAAAPGEEVVFDGSGLNGHDQDQDGPSMFWLYGCGYVQLSGFEIRGARGRDASAILLEPGTHHVVVSDMYIHNITTPSPKSGDHCANAILVMGRSGSTISNVLLFRNTIENCETGWSEAIAISANVADVNIVGNRLDDTGNIAICFAGNYGNAPSSVDYPRDGLVFGNVVTNCHCLYDTGFAIYADGTQNVDFVSNTVRNCDGGIEAGCEHGGHSTRNILIANNLLTDCAEAAVGLGTPGGGGRVESVTVYGNRYRHVGWLSGGASILRFGTAGGVNSYDNSYLENDADMELPDFPTFTNPGLH